MVVQRSRRIIGVGAVLVLSIAVLCGVGFVSSADDCYEDLIVSGAGSAWLNGTYVHDGQYHGKPFYSALGSEGSVYWDGSAWILEDEGPEMYICTQNTSTPPSTGWELQDGDPPAPTMSGGGPCYVAPPRPAKLAIEILPAGAGDSVLDHPLPLDEGEDPPMVGTQPLCGIYEVGEIITGGCIIRYTNGDAVYASFIHIYVYSVDVSTVPEKVSLITHWIERYDAVTGQYRFAIATDGWAPGYYDLRLSFADGSALTVRIQLVATIG